MSYKTRKAAYERRVQERQARRAALRAKRRLENTLNRNKRAAERRERREAERRKREEANRVKYAAHESHLPIQGELTHRGTWDGAKPIKITVKGKQWERNHSATQRRKKPLSMEPGFYTAIAACLRWSSPLVGVYTNKKVQFTRSGTLEESLLFNPWRAKGVIGQVTGFGSGYYPITPVDSASIVGNTVLKQIQSRKLNLAVSVAEGRDTMAFLAKSHQDVARLVDKILDAKGKPGASFKRLAMQHPRQPPRLRDMSVMAFNRAKPADRWLAYNFALLPLIDDVQGAAEVLADIWAPKVRNLYASASHRRADGISVHATPGLVQEGFSILHEGVVHTRTVQRVDYQVSDLTIKRLSELGVLNPASVMYEKTPYSFVLDWVLPIGEFLSLWQAPVGCSFVAGYQGCYMHSEVVKSFAPTAILQPSFSIDSSPIPCYYRGYIRRVIATFPYPSLYVKNPLSSWTALTSAALYQKRLNPPKTTRKFNHA